MLDFIQPWNQIYHLLNASAFFIKRKLPSLAILAFEYKSLSQSTKSCNKAQTAWQTV